MPQKIPKKKGLPCDACDLVWDESANIVSCRVKYVYISVYMYIGI